MCAGGGSKDILQPFTLVIDVDRHMTHTFTLETLDSVDLPDDPKLLVTSSVSLPSWASSLGFHFALIESVCDGRLLTFRCWGLLLYYPYTRSYV